MSKAKPLAKRQANAVRLMLKNKDELRVEVRKETETEDALHYLVDIFYVNVTGTLTFVIKNGEVTIASLNLSNGSVYTLQNDSNLRKLCEYVRSTLQRTA